MLFSSLINIFQLQIIVSIICHVRVFLTHIFYLNSQSFIQQQQNKVAEITETRNEQNKNGTEHNLIRDVYSVNRKIKLS